MKISVLALLAAGALALSGCSSATIGTGGGGARMTASAAGSLATNGNPLSTGTVTRTASSLSIDLDGKHYDLPIKFGEGTVTQGGRTYHVASYRDTTNPTAAANDVDLQYASLIVLGKVASWNAGNNTGTFGKFEVLATGTVETPTGSLPAQIVQYDGQYVLALGTDTPTPMAGTFTATADFNAHTVAIATSDKLLSTLATISGSHFSADINSDDGISLVSGKLAGGFYGPAAEEMAGVAGGTITCKTPGTCAQNSMTFSAGFLGGKSP